MYLWFLAFTLQAYAEQILQRFRKTGTTVQSIDVPGLMSLEVGLPSLVEQQRIVDLIGALDVEIETMRLEIAAVAQARDASRESMLAPRAGWRLVKLGEVLSIARGGSPRPIDDYFTEEPNAINWIKIGDVPPGGKYIDRTAQRIRPEGASRSRRVVPGDFVLSNSMSFGRPYILRIDGCIHDGWLVLRDTSGTFDQDFLYNLLSSRGVQGQFTALASGSAVKNLNINLVESVTVVVPPLDEQMSVSALLNDFEVALTSLNAEEAALSVLRGTLLHRLLRGEVTIPESYDLLLGEAM